MCRLSGRGRGRKRARTDSTTTPTESPPKLQMSARNSTVKHSPKKAASHSMHWYIGSLVGLFVTIYWLSVKAWYFAAKWSKSLRNYCWFRWCRNDILGEWENKLKLIVRYMIKELRQDAQLSQRDRAAGCVIVFAKSSRLELGDNNLRT